MSKIFARLAALAAGLVAPAVLATAAVAGTCPPPSNGPDFGPAVSDWHPGLHSPFTANGTFEHGRRDHRTFTSGHGTVTFTFGHGTFGHGTGHGTEHGTGHGTTTAPGTARTTAPAARHQPRHRARHEPRHRPRDRRPRHQPRDRRARHEPRDRRARHESRDRRFGARP